MRAPRLAVVLAIAALLPLTGAAAAATGAAKPPPDLTTPRRALRSFLDAAREGDYAAAAKMLDLGAVPEASRSESGPRLAWQLDVLLDAQVAIDWDRLSDEPEGDPAGTPAPNVIASLAADGAAVPLRLSRSRDGDWRIARGTVMAVPRLYHLYGPGWLGDRLPPVLFRVRFLDLEAWQWIVLAIAAAAALVASLGGGSLGTAAALFVARRTGVAWHDRLARLSAGPARLLLGIAGFAAVVETARLSSPARDVVDHLLRAAATVAFAWVALAALMFAGEAMGERLARGKPDAPGVRAAITRIMVLKRVAGFVVVLVAGAVLLLQFEALRTLGTSLLASAGFLGVVVGFAAQRSLATVLAGIQLSITQPIRVGDVVVLDGDFGTIEEITLTYVVVKIWDLRRKVVPITKFLEAPFENWSRTGTEMLGTVFVRADFAVPVGEVRREVLRFLATRPEWDGRVANLQVTDATERTVELRVLASAADSDRSWELRCAVREHLVAFLQRLEGGRFLPLARVEWPAAADQGGGAARSGKPPASAAASGAPRSASTMSGSGSG